MSNHPVRLLRMVLDYGVGTSEESLVRYFETFGPVIAIGKPGERLATPGASRMYVEDARWQDAIRAELERAQAVVVQPGSTSGVRWELEQIRAGVEPYRVLLCLVSFWRNPQAYEDLANLARECLRLELPRVVPFLDRPCFLFFDRGWTPQLQLMSYKNPIWWPLTSDATDLPYTLHPFVQGMHGGEREVPRRPLWTKGAGRVTAEFAALGLALLVMTVPVLVVHSFAQNVVGAFVGSTSNGQVPDAVARSPRVTLSGGSVPYRFEVPEALVKVAPDAEGIEHARKSPDGRFSVQVIASTEAEDVSNLAELRLKKNSGTGVLESNLESVRTVPQAGVDWVEARIYAKLENGFTAREVTRATSNAHGTVIVIVHVLGVPDLNPVYRNLAEEILSSFRFAERADRGKAQDVGRGALVLANGSRHPFDRFTRVRAEEGGVVR
jgi:hypothetical protein